MIGMRAMRHYFYLELICQSCFALGWFKEDLLLEVGGRDCCLQIQEVTI